MCQQTSPVWDLSVAKGVSAEGLEPCLDGWRCQEASVDLSQQGKDSPACVKALSLRGTGCAWRTSAGAEGVSRGGWRQGWEGGVRTLYLVDAQHLFVGLSSSDFLL